MNFRTRLDITNRQVKQLERTDVSLSGSSVFGLPFSALTTGPSQSVSGISETVINVVSTFSGNTGTTVFTFGDSRMNLAATSFSAITPSNSAITQDSGNVWTGNTSQIVDGNFSYLDYSGVSFPLSIETMTETSPNIFTGSCLSDDVFILSADTLDFTGRTIWVDNPEITRTNKLIVSDGAISGYVLKSDSEGMATWQVDASGATSTSFWSAGTGTGAIVQLNSVGVASGDYAVSEGFNTKAIGNYSHAQGNNVNVYGDYGHGEGLNTISSGTSAHAEGSLTQANGNYSHAEGSGTLASGNNSHTEGLSTSATTFHAHAEGQTTLASANSAHAEGFDTIASGNYSHAEGQGSVASGQSAHAEGQSTVAGGNTSHAEGQFSIASGTYSHAEGQSTTASGTYSHAEGRGSIASNLASHAEGQFSIASGLNSHAEGAATIASGNTSHAEGNTTVAGGVYSHAEGNLTIASGEASHAGGKGYLTAANRIEAGGIASFIHFEQTTASGLIGAYGDYSAILGGINHNIGTGSTYSTILGGDANLINDDVLRSSVVGGSNITATTSDMVYVPDLVIDGLVSTDPLATDANGKIVAGASDARLKTNINVLESALDKIKNLRGVSYEWTEESNMGSGVKKYGLIAQEVQEVIPDMVRKRAKGDGMLTLAYTEVVPWLIEAIKELASGSTVRNELILETQTIASEDNNIELNYGGNHDTAIGGGVKVLDAIKDGVHSEIKTDENGGWVVSPSLSTPKLILPEYTPTSTNDESGVKGDTVWNDDYIYIKTNSGWRRSSLENF